ncbi:hypothetical protein GGR57DRAFT_293511 [Xylariaceae sp. FL1272]|nr:hypothetical protein GGR57DRAFT_293511 [Xylariaceae sp. FL1272]
METGSKTGRKNHTSQMESIFQDIQSIYDSGAPIFTKNEIRKVGDDLQKFLNGHYKTGSKVTMRGVNGLDYEMVVNSYHPDKPRENQVEGGSKWEIFYKSIRYLTTFEVDPQTAYLPMNIRAVIRLMDKMDPRYRDPPVPAAEAFVAYRKIKEEWKTSEHYTQLQEILHSVRSTPVITKFIGMALGPLVIGSVISKPPILQHALLRTLHEILTKRNIYLPEARTYVQDPAYTQRDMEVLRLAGFTVLDDPQALLELEESSLLLCISPDLPIKEIVADICRPSIIIWNRNSAIVPDTPRVSQMVNQEYWKIDLPSHPCFGDLDFLIRKADCQDTDRQVTCKLEGNVVDGQDTDTQ